MGNYHPHGDSAIYDTLVRMAQDFSMRELLVDGQGNFGSIDDDPAAAMRYTEARMTRIAQEMLRDLDMDTVDFGPNYDGSKREPLVLPSRYPNLLVNGSSGIAVGMATNIPPHNLREVVGAVIAYIDNPSITVEELMRDHVQGPDFPTGGIILGRSGIRDAYETGRGRVRVRAKAHTEEIGRGKEAIIVTELPFMVKKGGDGGLITKIAQLVIDKKIAGIANIEDHTDKRGMRVVIELKRDADPRIVLNQLYKHTPMQTTFGVNAVALVDGVPKTLSLREFLHHYVDHQRDVVVRRSKYELAQLEREVHILEGQLIALDNLDEVIAVIRALDATATPRARSSSSASSSRSSRPSAILQMRLSQLTSLEADEIRQKHAEKIERIGELRKLLGDEQRSRPHQGGAPRAHRPLRRRAAHADRALRGRDRHRGPHPRPADGRDDHEERLHQDAAARDLPPAAPRRGRRDGDGPQGGRLHRAPLRVLDARLPPVLLEPGEGLPVEGLRAARRWAAPRAAARSSTCCRCARASGSSPCSPRATSPRASTSCSRRARASSRRRSSSPTTRRSRPTASSRSRSATTTSSSPSGGPAATTRSS